MTCRAIVQNKPVRGKVRQGGLVVIVVKRHDESWSLFTQQDTLLVQREFVFFVACLGLMEIRIKIQISLRLFWDPVFQKS